MAVTTELQNLTWLERMQSSRVDRAAGVIHGVKIIGTSSRNGRTYSESVLRKAAPLYEGIVVNVDHPKHGHNLRSAEDRFGRLYNVEFRTGANPGLYGDLYYLTSHPLANRIAEAVERMPDLFGLSHNADGEGRRTAAGFLVEEITKVISVDIVTDPATNSSLFEQESVEPRSPRKPSESEEDSGRERAISELRKKGGEAAADIVRKLYARMIVGVNSSPDLSPQEKEAKISEMIRDQEYFLQQVGEFGEFYHRWNSDGDELTLPGDHETTNRKGDEVMAEQAMPRGEAFRRLLQRSDDELDLPMAGGVVRRAVTTEPMPRGKALVESLMLDDELASLAESVGPTRRAAPISRNAQSSMPRGKALRDRLMMSDQLLDF